MLRDLVGRSEFPWCVLWNSNDIMYVHEKYGRRAHPRALREDFSDVVNECGLVDLGFVGNEFTWRG